MLVFSVFFLPVMVNKRFSKYVDRSVLNFSLYDKYSLTKYSEEVKERMELRGRNWVHGGIRCPLIKSVTAASVAVAVAAK